VVQLPAGGRTSATYDGNGKRRSYEDSVMLGGALFGILLDLIEYVPPIGPWLQHWSGAAWLTGFHHSIQHNLIPAHWPLGGGTQAAVLAVGLAICLVQSRRAGTSAVVRLGRT